MQTAVTASVDRLVWLVSRVNTKFRLGINTARSATTSEMLAAQSVLRRRLVLQTAADRQLTTSHIVAASGTIRPLISFVSRTFWLPKDQRKKRVSLL